MSSNIALFKAAQNKKLEKAGLPKMSTASEMFQAPRLSSGILSLDVALGGGWAGNRWIEVYGHESSAKTTTILQTIAHNQRTNPDFHAFWLAGEPYDRDWAAKNGVDNDRVVVLETQHMEGGLDAVIAACESRNFDVCVIDSYPALLPEQEGEDPMDKLNVGMGARVLNKFFRKIGPSFNSERPYTGFLVNQFRDRIVLMGDPRTTPGGKGKDYAAYQKAVTGRKDWIKEKREGYEGDFYVGQTTKIEVTKNKAGAPKQVATYDIYFEDSEKGFRPGELDFAKDIVQVAQRFRIFEKSGNWLKFEGQQWNGKDAAADGIREDLDLKEKLYARVMEMITTSKD